MNFEKVIFICEAIAVWTCVFGSLEKNNISLNHLLVRNYCQHIFLLEYIQ